MHEDTPIQIDSSVVSQRLALPMDKPKGILTENNFTSK